VKELKKVEKEKMRRLGTFGWLGECGNVFFPGIKPR